MTAAPATWATVDLDRTSLDQAREALTAWLDSEASAEARGDNVDLAVEVVHRVAVALAVDKQRAEQLIEHKADLWDGDLWCAAGCKGASGGLRFTAAEFEQHLRELPHA